MDRMPPKVIVLNESLNTQLVAIAKLLSCVPCKASASEESNLLIKISLGNKKPKIKGNANRSNSRPHFYNQVTFLQKKDKQQVITQKRKPTYSALDSTN